MKAKVKFKADHYIYKAGDEVLLADSTAKTLVESGVATLVKKKK
jgi:hypothetical protein